MSINEEISQFPPTLNEAKSRNSVTRAGRRVRPKTPEQIQAIQVECQNKLSSDPDNYPQWRTDMGYDPYCGGIN